MSLEELNRIERMTISKWPINLTEINRFKQEFKILKEANKYY